MDNLSYRNNIIKERNLINLNKCKSLLKNKLPLIGKG